MSDKYNICNRRAGILNLVAQHERGCVSTLAYKTNTTSITVNQLPKFCELPTIGPGFKHTNWCSLRNNAREHLIGVSWNSDESETYGVNRSELRIFKFDTSSSYCEKDVSISTPSSIKKVHQCGSLSFANIKITDTADLNYQNQYPLLVVGNSIPRKIAFFLTANTCEDGTFAKDKWQMQNIFFCCATSKHSVNFAIGGLNSFFVFKDFRLYEACSWQGDIVAAEFNVDGNLLLTSSTKSGIGLWDLRGCFTKDKTKKIIGEGEPVVDDPSFFAYRMKLLSDQFSLIVSDELGHISKIDLRMCKPVFEYAEHELFPWRRPLNIYEDLDLLCAVDNDNYCRIWSLSSGKLHWKDRIPHIGCSKDAYPCHACIVSSGRRWFLTTFQNNFITSSIPDETPKLQYQFLE